MKGNFQVRFLGEGAAAMRLSYPRRVFDQFDLLHDSLLFWDQNDLMGRVHRAAIQRINKLFFDLIASKERALMFGMTFLASDFPTFTLAWLLRRRLDNVTGGWPRGGR